MDEFHTQPLTMLAKHPNAPPHGNGGRVSNYYGHHFMPKATNFMLRKSNVTQKKENAMFLSLERRRRGSSAIHRRSCQEHILKRGGKSLVSKKHSPRGGGGEAFLERLMARGVSLSGLLPPASGLKRAVFYLSSAEKGSLTQERKR